MEVLPTRNLNIKGQIVSINPSVKFHIDLHKYP